MRRSIKRIAAPTVTATVAQPTQSRFRKRNEDDAHQTSTTAAIGRFVNRANSAGNTTSTAHTRGATASSSSFNNSNVHYLGRSSPTDGFDGLSPGAIYNFLSREVMTQQEYEEMLQKRLWLSESFLKGYNLWDHLPEAERSRVRAKLAEWGPKLRAVAKEKGGGEDGTRNNESESETVFLEPLRPFVFLYGSCLAGTAFRHGDADFALTFPTTSIVGHAVVAASLDLRRDAGEDVTTEAATFAERLQRALARGSFEHDFSDAPSLGEDFASDGGTFNAPRLNVDGSIVPDMTLMGGIFSSKVAQQQQQPSTSSTNNKNSNGSKFTSSSLEASPCGSPYTHAQLQQQSADATTMDVTKKPISITDLRFSTKSDFFAVARIVHPQVLTTFYSHIARAAEAQGVETDDDDVAKALRRAEQKEREEKEEREGSKKKEGAEAAAVPIATATTATQKKKRTSILAALEDELPVRGSTAPALGSGAAEAAKGGENGKKAEESKRPKLFLHRIFRARVPIMQFAPPEAMVTETAESIRAMAATANGGRQNSNKDSPEEEVLQQQQKESTATTIDDDDFDLIMSSEEADGGEVTPSVVTNEATPSSASPPTPASSDEDSSTSAPQTTATAAAVAAAPPPKPTATESLIDRLLREDAATAAPPSPTQEDGASSPIPPKKASRFERRGNSDGSPLGGGTQTTGSAMLDKVLGRGAFAPNATASSSSSSEPSAAADSIREAAAAAKLRAEAEEAAAARLHQSKAAVLAASEERERAKEAAKVTLSTSTFSRFFKASGEAAERAAATARASETIAKAAAARAAKQLLAEAETNNNNNNNNNSGLGIDGTVSALLGGAARPAAAGELGKKKALLTAASIPQLILNAGPLSSAAASSADSSFPPPADPFSLQARDERLLASTPTHKQKKEHMDLSVALEGCRNSLLVRAYMQQYPIAIRGATLLLKHWGRRQQILNARRGWLSPYALTIMFIHAMHEHGVIGGLLSTGAGVDAALCGIARAQRLHAQSLASASPLASSASAAVSSAAAAASSAPLPAYGLSADISHVLPPFPHPSAHADVLLEYALIPDLMRLFFCYYGGSADPAGEVAACSAVLGVAAADGSEGEAGKEGQEKKGVTKSGGKSLLLDRAKPFDFDHNVVDIRPAPDRYTLRSEWDDALIEQLGTDTRAASAIGGTSSSSSLSAMMLNGSNSAGEGGLNLDLSAAGADDRRRKKAAEKKNNKGETADASTTTTPASTNSGSGSTTVTTPQCIVHPRFAHLSAEALDELQRAARRERWHRLGHEAVLIRDPYEDHSLGRSVEFFHAEAIREEFRKASGMRYGGLSDAADFLR